MTRNSTDHKEEHKENILKLINTSSDLQGFLLQGKLANEEMIEKGGFCILFICLNKTLDWSTSGTFLVLKDDAVKGQCKILISLVVFVDLGLSFPSIKL